MNMLSIVESNL
jgi:hypothetical protein